MLPGSMDHVALDHQVHIYKIGSKGVVRNYSSDFGGGNQNVFRFLCRKKGINGVLICQIKFLHGSQDKVIIALFPQGKSQRRSDKTGMTGNVNPRISLHIFSFFLQSPILLFSPFFYPPTP